MKTSNEESRKLKIIEACSVFYNFHVLKEAFASHLSSKELFKIFLKNYAGERRNAPKQLYLLGIQSISEYGFDLKKIQDGLRKRLNTMKKSYNLFESNFDGKNIFQLWESIYDSIQNKKFKDAYFNLCRLNGVSGKISAFFLRDVCAALYNCDKPGKCPTNIDENDLIFMQPIDIWVREIADIICNKVVVNKDFSKVPKGFYDTLSERKKDYEKIVCILTKCKKHNINPLCFNQGAWFFSSQIAGNMEYMKEIISEGGESIHNAVKNAQAYLDKDRFDKYMRIVSNI